MAKFVQIGRYAFNPERINYIAYRKEKGEIVSVVIVFGPEESDLTLYKEDKDSFLFWWENYAEVEKVV